MRLCLVVGRNELTHHDNLCGFGEAVAARFFFNGDAHESKGLDWLYEGNLGGVAVGRGGELACIQEGAVVVDKPRLVGLVVNQVGEKDLLT